MNCKSSVIIVLTLLCFTCLLSAQTESSHNPDKEIHEELDTAEVNALSPERMDKSPYQKKENGSKKKFKIEAKVNPTPALWSIFSPQVEIGISKKIGLEGDFMLGKNIMAGVVIGKYYMQPQSGFDRFYVSTFAFGVDGEKGIGFGWGYKVVCTNGLLFEAGLGTGKTSRNHSFRVAKLHVGYRFR